MVPGRLQSGFLGVPGDFWESAVRMPAGQVIAIRVPLGSPVVPGRVPSGS